jgi:hypothetical protein
MFTLWVCALASDQGLKLFDDAVQRCEFYRHNYVGAGLGARFHNDRFL